MFGQDVHVCSAQRSVEDNSFLLHQMPKADNLVKTSKCVCWEGATRRIVNPLGSPHFLPNWETKIGTLFAQKLSTKSFALDAVAINQSVLPRRFQRYYTNNP